VWIYAYLTSVGLPQKLLLNDAVRECLCDVLCELLTLQGNSLQYQALCYSQTSKGRILFSVSRGEFQLCIQCIHISRIYILMYVGAYIHTMHRRRYVLYKSVWYLLRTKSVSYSADPLYSLEINPNTSDRSDQKMIYILNFTRGRGIWLDSAAKKSRILSCLEMVFNYLQRCSVFLWLKALCVFN
jgi:hypothetical protein